MEVLCVAIRSKLELVLRTKTRKKRVLDYAYCHCVLNGVLAIPALYTLRGNIAGNLHTTKYSHIVIMKL